MSQFGGSSKDDDFGYFGPPKASSAGSQFGGPPAASSQFGAPPPPFGSAPGATTQFGTPAPAPYASQPPTKQHSKGKRGALVAVALVAIVGGSFAWNAYQTSRPVVIPATLSGLPTATDPRLTAAVAEGENGLRADNPGAELGAQGYGSAKGFEFLIVLRGRVHVDQEFADFAKSFGGSIGPSSQVGKSTCAQGTAAKITYCVRTSRTLTVEVASISGPSASAAVDEAWAQQ